MATETAEEARLRELLMASDSDSDDGEHPLPPRESEGSVEAVEPEPAPPTPPPGPVLWLAARLHPTLIAANSRALKSLETRPWLACVDEWRTRDKPKMDAAALELGAVDLAALSDEGVAAHCEACVAHLEAAYYSHGALTPGPMFGLALLLHRYGAYADDRELVEAATDAREAWDHSAERPLRRLACCMAT